MAHALIDIAVRHIRSLVEEHALAAAADGELLARFADRREEAAFAVLLRRHGPMVLGVCRRVLKSYHDAEDVFQAAFLLLARKAGSVRKRASVGCWLHGVAHRLAVKMKAQAECRRSHETRAKTMRQTEATGRAPRHLEDLLDEALRRLPEHYRTALVLCHLEGRTHEEAARQLGCPLATLRSRLARGRKRLRAELMRRGLVLAAGIKAVALTACKADAALPAFLVRTTLKAAIPFAAGRTIVGVVPAALAEAGLKAIAMMKIKIVILLIAALGLAAGAGAIACQAFAEKPAPEAPPAAKRQAEMARKSEPQVRLDDYGDPLPDGAVRRVGTLRFRHGGGQVNSLIVCPDGKTLISGTYLGDRKIRTWDIATGKLLHSFPGSFEFHQVALSPDGTTLAESHENDVIHLWVVTTGKESRRLEWADCRPCGLAFSPDGQTLATAGDDDCVGLWDATTGKAGDRLELHTKGASVLAFSADGKYLTAGGESGELIAWRMSDEDERRRLVGRDGAVGYIAFAPDGNSFLWTQGKTIRISEVETWVELGRFNGRDMDASCFALSPDGKTLATGGGKTIQLWDLETGSHLLQFSDEKADMAAILFAPDGKTLASASPDGAVLLWDLKGLSRSRLEWLWRELSGNDAADAVHAVRTMKSTPAESVAFLRERIRPAPPPASDVGRLVADLDNDDFTERERATTELAKRGRKVETELRQAYEKQPAAEMRYRLQTLLARLKDAPNEETAKVRAVQVLETIGAGEARTFLETLAKGPPGSRVTQEAKASLQRLNAPPAP